MNEEEKLHNLLKTKENDCKSDENKFNNIIIDINNFSKRISDNNRDLLTQKEESDKKLAAFQNCQAN